MLKGNFYRNLDRKHSEQWSMQVKGADGKVKAHRVVCAVCYDLKVGGLTSKQFERCVSGEGPRKVFAWFKGRIEPDTQRPIDGLRRVYFNPTIDVSKGRLEGDRFFHTSDGERVDSAEYAVFTPDGQMWIP